MSSITLQMASIFGNILRSRDAGGYIACSFYETSSHTSDTENQSILQNTCFIQLHSRIDSEVIARVGRQSSYRHSHNSGIGDDH